VPPTVHVTDGVAECPRAPDRASRHTYAVTVEVDQQLAAALGRRLADSGVQVVQADATALPFHSRRFSAVACFTMLHHVPTVAMQDHMLREFRRVLRPGGILVGTDGMDTPGRREVHVGDVFLPVLPTSCRVVCAERASPTRRWTSASAVTDSGSSPPAQGDAPGSVPSVPAWFARRQH
jgi:ubiquinone/menaquinone biosynthesis C-methylase UbiE